MYFIYFLQLCQQYSNKMRVICARICGRGGIADGAGGEGGRDYLLRNPEDDDYESGSGSYPVASSVDMNREFVCGVGVAPRRCFRFRFGGGAQR